MLGLPVSDGVNVADRVTVWLGVVDTVGEEESEGVTVRLDVEVALGVSD